MGRCRIILYSIFIMLNLQLIVAQEDLHLIKTYVGTEESKLLDFNVLGDIDGDGRSDFSLGYNSSYEFFCWSSKIYLGNSSLSDSSDICLSGLLFGVGDINKDGYDDFILRKAEFVFPQRVTLIIYWGSKDIVNNLRSDTLYQSNLIKERLGSFIKNGGDINRDGYDDILIGSWYNWGNGIGRAYIFYGGETINKEPDVTLIPQKYPGSFIISGDGIGDINNDGYDDFIIVHTDSPSEEGSKALLYFGGPEIKNEVDSIFYKSDYSLSVKKLNDINTDGKPEFGLIIRGKVKIYSGFNNYLTFDIHKYGYGGSIDISGSGDINGDKINDFVCSNANHLNSNGIATGGIWCYFGKSKLDTIPDLHFHGENKWSGYGIKTEIIGYINNDGYAEIGALASSFRKDKEIIGKVYIYSMKNFVGVEDLSALEKLAEDYELSQNYPNPFNPTTTIRYKIPVSGKVILKLYDVLGRETGTLVNEFKSAGSYSSRVNIKNLSLSSGVYYYKLDVIPDRGGEIYSKTKKMLLIK